MSRPSDMLDITGRSSKDVQVAARGERSIKQLVTDATQDMSELVRHEIALAKVELKKEATTAGIGGGMLGGAAVFGFVGFIMLCLTAAYGLVKAGLETWIAFGIVTLVLLVIAAILALLGKGKLSKLGPPEKTIASAKNTVAALKGKR